MHFYQHNSMFGTPLKLNVPSLYNLIQDPKEKYSIEKVDASAAWVLPVILKRIVDFQKTLHQEPPIKLGTPDPYSPSNN